MKNKFILFLLATFLIVTIPDFLYSGNTFDQNVGPARKYVQGELLVKYKSGVRTAAAFRYHQELGFSTIRRFKTIPVSHVKLPRHMSTEQALEILNQDPDVEYAEPNYLRRTCAIIPDDSLFSESWGLNNTGQTVRGSAGTSDADIDAPEAWEISTGNDDVIIAVIDSGVDYNHPDLKNNIWTNTGEIPDNGIDDDGNGYTDDVNGWNFLQDNNDPMDSNHHGTHVAGVIAGVGNNASGTAGVCWQAKIMPLKFLDPFGTGSIAHEILAIQYAVENGAKIINASFGDPGESFSESNAIGAALSAGVLFVAAAGNTGADIDADTPLYPASYTFSNIISVTASNEDDGLPFWANYGAFSVDVAAPGANIYSTTPGRVTVWEEDLDGPGALSGWTLEGTWGLTTAESLSGSYSVTDSPSGNYASNTDFSAVSPAMDFTGKSNIRLNFFLTGKSQFARDKLYVETSLNPGGPWSDQEVEVISNSATADYFLDGISGEYTSWAYATVVLDHLEGSDEAYFRFRLETDALSTEDGWYIDSIKITSVDGTYPESEKNYYRHLDGTSAATPFVSGLAGLIWGHVPALSLERVKEVIMDGVDEKSAFSGKTLSDGRINALRSLNLALNQSNPPPSNNGGTIVGSDSSGGFCFIKTAH